MIGKYVMMTVALCCGYIAVSAQDRKLIKEGNNLYEQKKYKEAAAVYQQALQKNPTNMTGMFNLGNALYQGKQVDAARNVMAATAKNATDKTEKSGAQYNLGNTYMDEKKYQDAIDYYKQALRNNPQDADAKYNLSYAYTMMKKDQQNQQQNKDKNKDQQNKNQQNQQNKDQQNKDQKNKDQQGKDKQDKDQQNKDQQNQKDKDNQEGQHPEPRPGKLSEKQADQILNALQQDEKNLQEKKQKAKGVPVKMDKDW